MSEVLPVLAWIVGGIAAMGWVLGAVYVGGCALAELVDVWVSQRITRVSADRSEG